MDDNSQKPKKGVNFALLKPDGKILMQLRDDGNGKKIPYPNMWAIPGGHVEDGESTLQALVREVKEEFDLGIDPGHCQFVISYNHEDDNWWTDVFICPVIQEVQLQKHEGAEIRWMGIEEIKELTLAWQQEKMIPDLEKAIKR